MVYECQEQERGGGRIGRDGESLFLKKITYNYKAKNPALPKTLPSPLSPVPSFFFVNFYTCFCVLHVSFFFLVAVVVVEIFVLNIVVF